MRLGDFRATAPFSNAVIRGNSDRNERGKSAQLSLTTYGKGKQWQLAACDLCELLNKDLHTDDQNRAGSINTECRGINFHVAMMQGEKVNRGLLPSSPLLFLFYTSHLFSALLDTYPLSPACEYTGTHVLAHSSAECELTNGEDLFNGVTAAPWRTPQLIVSMVT